MLRLAARFVVCTAFVASALVGAACSGTAGEDLFATGAGAETTPAPSWSTEFDGDPPTTLPDATPLPPPPPPPLDAGTDADAGPPPPSCTTEIEPNNDLLNATPFTTAFCGKIGTRADLDFGKITAPVTATKITYKHQEEDGKVAYRFYVNGAQLPPQVDGKLPLVPGAIYSVQARLAPDSNTTDRPLYEIEFLFE